MKVMPQANSDISANCPPVLRIGITGGIASGKSFVCRQLSQAGHTVFYCDDEAKRIIRSDEQVRQSLTHIVGNDLYDDRGQLVKHVLAAYLCRGKDYAHQVDAVVHPCVAAAFRQMAEEKLQALSVGRKGETTEREAAPDTVQALTNNAQATTALPQAPKPLPSTLIQFWQRHNEPALRQIDLPTLLNLPPQRVIFMECALLFESGFDSLVHTSVLVHTEGQTQIARLMARDNISLEKAQRWLDLQMSEAERMRRSHFILPND